MTPTKLLELAGHFRRRLLTGLLLLCVIIVVYAFYRPGKPLPFAVLTRTFKLPVPFRERFDSCLPRTSTWTWAWRVEQRIFGQRKPILLDGEILSFADPSSTILSSLALVPILFSDPNGLQEFGCSARKS